LVGLYLEFKQRELGPHRFAEVKRHLEVHAKPAARFCRSGGHCSAPECSGEMRSGNGESDARKPLGGVRMGNGGRASGGQSRDQYQPPRREDARPLSDALTSLLVAAAIAYCTTYFY